MAYTKPDINLYFDKLITYDLDALFSSNGGSIVRIPIEDCDGSGNRGFIVNLNFRAQFALIREKDLTILWNVTKNTTTGKGAYFPKLTPDGTAFLYGTQAEGVVYCVDVDDGATRWSYTVAGGTLSSIEVCDVGFVVGSSGAGGEVTILDFTTGAERTGWPVAVQQHEQLICAGDLDGDTEDEIVLNDNSGNVYVYDRDGNLIDSLNSGQTHVDNAFIVDYDADSTAELVLVLDDDSSTSGTEGDELRSFTLVGGVLTPKHNYTFETDSPAIVIRKIRDDIAGMQIIYALEGTVAADNIATVGMLNASFQQVWETQIPEAYRGADQPSGQVVVGDFDGSGNYLIAVNTGQDVNGLLGGYDGGLAVFDASGNFVTAVGDNGWDFDQDAAYANGDPQCCYARDIDSDGRDEFWGSVSSDVGSTGNEYFHILRMNVPIVWGPTGHSHRKLITIQADQVDATLERFPVLVEIVNDADIGAIARSDGFDIRFAGPSDTDLLPYAYEKESFAIAGGLATGRFWVNIPSIDATTGATFYIYYGDADAADGENAPAAWNEEYLIVAHLQESPTASAPQFTDSTWNNRDGTADGSWVSGDSVAVEVLNGVSLEGDDHVVDFQTPYTMAQLAIQYTIEQWAKPDVVNENNVISSYRSNTVDNPIAWQVDHNNADARMLVRDNTGTIGVATKASALSAGTTYYIVGRRAGNTISVFVDGVKGTDDTDAYGTITPVKLYVGGNATSALDPATTTEFKGDIDEFRLSKGERSDAWIKFTFNNIRSADNELTIGAAESSGVSIPIAMYHYQHHLVS